MTIPRPADTAELVGDDQLQEVALGTEVADEDEAPIPPLPPGETATEEIDEPPPEPPPALPRSDTRGRSRGGTMRRTRGGTMRRTKGAKGGGSSRANWPRQKKGGSTGVVVTLVVVGVVIAVILVAVAAGGGSSPADPGSGAPGGGRSHDSGSDPAPSPVAGPVHPQLQSDCNAYLDAINRGNIAEAAGFYEQSGSARSTVVALIENGTTYTNVNFLSADGSTGTVVFNCTYTTSAGGTQQGKQVTMTWKQGDEGWKIAGGR